MELSHVLRERRSIRKFTERTIERSTLEEILAEASWAPSGGNLQPWKIAILGGERLRTYLAEHESDAVDLLAIMMKISVIKSPAQNGDRPPDLNDFVVSQMMPMVRMTDAPPSHMLVLYYERDGFSDFIATMHHALSFIGHILARRKRIGERLHYLGLMLSCFLRLCRMNGTAKTIGLSNFAYAVTLAAFNRGIDSCIQCRFAGDVRPLRKLLGLKRRHDVLACISLGYGRAPQGQEPARPLTRQPVPTTWYE